VYIAQKKGKARALWTHILIISYISRQFAIERCKVKVHPPSQHRSIDRYFLTQKRRLQQRRAQFTTLYQTARALRAVRRITRRLSVCPSVKYSDGNPYPLLVLPVHSYIPKSCLEDENSRLDKGRHSSNHPLQKSLRQNNQPQLYSYVSSITCSAGIPLTRN
jgi:hypothetical protein